MQLKKYHFDITDVLEFARFNATLSGIQRVSLRIIGHLLEQHGRDRIRLIAFHPTLRRVVEIDSTFLHPNYSFNQEDFCKHCNLSSEISLKIYLKKKYMQRNKRRFHRFRLKFLNYATYGQTFAKRGLNGTSRGLRDAQLCGTDTVIMLGATWNFDTYLLYLKQQTEKSGVKVMLFVHDLIPLVVPEHVVDHVPDQFSQWLRSISEITDSFLVNSYNTKADLSMFLNEAGFGDKEISVVQLAHEFMADGPNTLPEHRTETKLIKLDQYADGLRTRAHVLNAARLPYVLSVGTIESRKNVWSLVNVWKALLDELGPSIPRLVLAGKHGWLKEDVDDFLRGTGHVNGYVRICERPYDFELAYLYRKCLFTVFPSYYEGWGLPIGESLWFGKFVVTSDRSSMPEVGGNMVDYVDPYSFDSMYQSIRKLIVDKDYLQKRTQQIEVRKLRTWKVVSDDLWNAITREQKLLPIGNATSIKR